MDFQYGNYGQAIGFGNGGLLAGLLPGNTPAQQAAYGQAMQGASQLAMNRAQENMGYQQQQMQNESQQRQQGNQNKAQHAQNASEERMGRGALANRQQQFNIGQQYGYAGINKRRQLGIQQSILNGLAGEG